MLRIDVRATLGRQLPPHAGQVQPAQLRRYPLTKPHGYVAQDYSLRLASYAAVWSETGMSPQHVLQSLVLSNAAALRGVAATPKGSWR